MITEIEADTFSSEDASNALIPCALSAVSYELLPNFNSILASSQGRQQKIKLFEVLALITKYVPKFLVTGDRFTEHVMPQISKAIGDLEPTNMLLVLLVKAQASLLNNMIEGLNRITAQEENKQSSAQNLLDAVQSLK